MISDRKLSLMRQIALCFVFFLTAFDLTAAVTVSRGRIASGFSVRSHRNTWAVFECFIENPDSTSHNVRVRVYNENEMSANCHTGEIAVQPGTSVTFRMPIMLDSSDVYFYDTFVDSVKQPKNLTHDCRMELLGQRCRFFGILNDSEQSFGGLSQLARYKNIWYVNNFGNQYIPDAGVQFEAYDAIVIFRPDFSLYTEKNFMAIMQYAANGGQVIFMGPEAICPAAKTPLRAMLSVAPGKVRRIVPPKALDTLLGHPVKWAVPSVDFVESAPVSAGVNIMEQDGMPFMRVSGFGLGTVKEIMVSLHEEQFKEPRNDWCDILECVFLRQNLCRDRQYFASVIDTLTGFSIPDSSDIRLILLFYLVFLSVILFIGRLTGRMPLAWCGAVVLSVAMTGYILLRAQASFSQRQSVLAEINVKNQSPVKSGESYAACFAMSEELFTANMGRNGTFVSSIADSFRIHQSFLSSRAAKYDDEGNPIADKRAQVRIKAPLDLFRSADGIYTLNKLNIAPRTSKQFMFTREDPAAPEGSCAGKEPVVYVGKDGIRLEPFKPEANLPIERAALFLPNGYLELKPDKNGEYSLTGSGTIFVDPVLTELLGAVQNGVHAPRPYVALIQSLPKNEICPESGNFIPQGKTVCLIPAKWALDSKEITLPLETITPAAGDTVTRMLFTGSNINTATPLMIGHQLSPGFVLPAEFGHLLKPEKITVSIDAMLSEEIDLSCVLLSWNGKYKKDGKKEYREIMPKKTAGHTFTFEGDLSGVLEKTTGMFKIKISTKQKSSRNAMSEEQMLRNTTWSMKSLSASVSGKFLSYSIKEKQLF